MTLTWGDLAEAWGCSHDSLAGSRGCWNDSSDFVYGCLSFHNWSKVMMSAPQHIGQCVRGRTQKLKARDRGYKASREACSGGLQGLEQEGGLQGGARGQVGGVALLFLP